MTDIDGFDFRTRESSDDRLILRRNVIRTGATDQDLRRAVNDNEIGRIRWGAYLPVETRTGVDSHEIQMYRYREMIRAVVETGTDRRFLSHQSAAVVHGLPMLNPDLTTVNFTAVKSGRTSPGLIVHQARITESDLITITGTTLTSLGRTVCDVARSGTLRQAICVVDAGRAMAAQQEEDLDLDGVVGRMTGLHGMPTVRLAIEHSVEVSGSVGESLSRAIMLEEGVPVPELQVLVELADGSTKFGDFGWRDAEGRLCVVGEFDGRFKYHRESAASGGRLAEDVIYDEKLREDAIRDFGIIVVRWTWDDLRNPRRFRERILTALRRAGLLTELD